MHYHNLTFERHLMNLGNQYHEYKELSDSWSTLKRSLTSVLSLIILPYPHYTRHDSSHSETILLNIERLLGDERIEQLGPSDTWLMLVSAYAHDIGMGVPYNSRLEIWKSDEFKTFLSERKKDLSQVDIKELADEVDALCSNDKNIPWENIIDFQWKINVLMSEFFRKTHSSLSKDFIEKSENIPFQVDFSVNGLIFRRIRYLLGEISCLHGKSFQDVMLLPKQENGIVSDHIHPRTIAALLRMGDLLDMDNGRFDYNMSQMVGELPEITKANIRKHEAVKHILVCTNHVEIEADCPDDNAYNLIRDWCGWLQDEVKNIALHWNDIMPDNFGEPFALPKIKLLMQGETVSNNKFLSFQINQKDIFSLLEGAGIYNSGYVFFREFIQNSIDASKLHLWMMVLDGEISIEKDLKNILPCDISDRDYRKFPIDVKIEYNSSKKKYIITIQDHGIGIKTDDLENISLTVNHSWNKRNHWNSLINDMPKWLRPTGTFGIGMQSVFQLTDSIQCDTHPIDEPTKTIRFSSKKNNGYIVVQKYEGPPLPLGTRFRAELDESRCKGITPCFDQYYSNALLSYDPFSTEPIMQISNMLDYIFSNALQSMFPIKVQAYIDNNLFHEREMNHFAPFPVRSNEFKKYGDHYFVSVDYSKSSFLVFDANNAISLRYQILGINKTEENSFYFKGISIDDCNIGYTLHEYGKLSVWFDGFDTAEYLSLNRTSFLDEKKNNVYKILDKILRYGIDAYFSKLPEHDNDIEVFIANNYYCTGQNGIYYWNALVALYDIFKYYDTEGNKLVIGHYILSKFPEDKCMNCLRRNDEGNFSSGTIEVNSVRESLWNGSVVWFMFKHTPNGIITTENEPLEILNSCHSSIPKNDLDYVIVCEPFYSLLRNKYLKIYIHLKENAFIAAYCRKKFSGIKKINIEGKVYFLKYLLAKPRGAIPGIYDYKYVIVNSIPKESWMINTKLQGWNIDIQSFILSPLTGNDITALRNTALNIDFIWSDLIGRSDFQSLVKYVKQNAAFPSSEDKILNTYRRMIEDMIGIIKSMQPV